MHARSCLAAFAVLALTACAHDNYEVIPGGAGSQARLTSDLRACKRIAIDEYLAKTRPDRGTTALAGVLAGGIGGAVVGAASLDQTELDKIDPRIEECMREKGYDGTSTE
jgi:hypothetical protein